MANKKLIWIGVASALLIGGGIFWWMKSKKEGENSNEGQPPMDESKKEQTEPTTSNSGSGSSGSLPQTPFRDKTEGNRFRGWMAKAHPDFRYKGDILDTTGGYDNDFMRKAWSLYGAEYTKATNPIKPRGLLEGDKLYLKADSAMVYSYPQQSGQYVLGELRKRIILDKPIGTLVSDTGTGFFKIIPLGYRSWNRKLNNYNTIFINNEGSTAYISKSFVSDRPY